MFKTTIDSKEIKVTFQHQKAAIRGQLTRPEILHGLKTIPSSVVVRVPVFATSFCFFNDLCMGVVFCSYTDEKRYSKEIGRRLSLKNALKRALRREGKNDHALAEGRAQVWEDYFRAEKGKRALNHPLVFGRAIRKMAQEKGMLTTEITPFPTEADLNHSGIPWRLGGHSAMNEETINHLNELDSEN